MADSAATDGVSFDDYDFDKGDRVHVDWSEGKSSLEEFIGTVEEISTSGGVVVVSVDCDPDTYPERSIYGGTHDAAPEWITVLDEQNV